MTEAGGELQYICRFSLSLALMFFSLLFVIVGNSAPLNLPFFGGLQEHLAPSGYLKIPTVSAILWVNFIQQIKCMFFHQFSIVCPTIFTIVPVLTSHFVWEWTLFLVLYGIWTWVVLGVILIPIEWLVDRYIIFAF